jgi:hypothetical protein
MNAPRSLNRLLRFALTITTLASSLAACGGGGTAVPPAPALAGVSAARVAGSIVVRIPRAGSTTNRRPRYVTLQSISAKVAIAPVQGCTLCSPPVTIEAALYGGNPCTINGPIKTCTIALNLLPGTYTGAMSLYDDVLDGQGHVTGKPITTNTSFPIPITAGASNAVGVTLDGIPTSVVATILTPSKVIARSRVVNGVTTTAYRVIGANASAQLTLAAKDADGSTIVGPGSPTWSASANPAGFTTAVNGNTLTLTSGATPTRQDATLTINAVSPACSDPTAKCTLSGFVGFAQTMAIADHGLHKVELATIGGGAANAVTQGLSFPCPAVAFASDGTLFVANVGNNTVTAYAPPYTGAPTVISAAVNTPVALAVDASNDLIVANNSAANATVYPPPYTTAAPMVLQAANQPVGLAIDAGKHLWITAASGSLMRYSAPYTPNFDIALGPGTSHLGIPSAIAVDTGGRAYVANVTNGNSVLRFDPPIANMTPALTIDSSTSSQPVLTPSAVAVAPDGTIFVANAQTVGLGLYSATGAPLGSAVGFYNSPRPSNVFAIDADGTMWLGGFLDPVGFPTPYSVTNFTSLPNSGAITPDAIAIYP